MTINLIGFVRDVFDKMDWPDGGDLDCDTFQELAVKHGLLIPTIMHAPCGEICQCAEVYDAEDWQKGVECYRIAPWLLEGWTTRADELAVGPDGGSAPLPEASASEKDGASISKGEDVCPG
jgi:hypothetical protein